MRVPPLSRELLEHPNDQPSFGGAALPLSVDAELSLALERLAREHRTTLFVTLLAGWAAVVCRLSGQHDIVVGFRTGKLENHDLESPLGSFANILGLRIDLSEDPTVEQLLARVRETVLGAHDHAGIPFQEVGDIATPTQSLAGGPLFPVIFSWSANASPALDLAHAFTSSNGGANAEVRFDIELALSHSRKGISGQLRYCTALFDAATIERHRGHLLPMLRSMVSHPREPILSADILPAAERELLLRTWNQTEASFPADKCIHQLFEEQVDKTPDAIAVVQDDVALTYAELNSLANRFAHRLVALGVRPESRVAICVDRRPHMLVGLLAILKAGGAYVPLDPTHPVDRLAELLADAEPCALLSDSVGLLALGQHTTAIPVIALDQRLPDGANDQHAASNLDPRSLGLSPPHLAYVIYTSGSTGKPKGVMVEHRNVVNLVAAANYVSVSPEDVFLHAAPLAFDASTFELWGALLHGARVALLRSGPVDPQDLAQALDRHHVSILFLTTVLFEHLCHSYLPTLARVRQVLMGGELMPLGTVRLALSGMPHKQLTHVYGPTETTTFATFYPFPESLQNSRFPIGRPIANTRIYLLDRHGQPVPQGAVGEIFIGGAGVARGYLHRAELTAERFLNDPFSGVPGARMYRTGDLARYLSDGNIEFLGRNDHQVKLRGFRIELGEIEARLGDHPAVREAVVVAREDSPGDKRLVAYVTPKPYSDLDPVALRDYLTPLLPEYMVPAAFVRLDTLPLTPNAKVDRKALPAPDAFAVASNAYEPPRGDVELAIAAIWSELLHVDRVGRHDNFFELGGHSLLAVRLISRLQSAMSVSVPLPMLHAQPTLSAFAEAVSQSSVETFPPIVKVSRDASLSLSFAQQRMWFLAQLEGFSAAYHIAVAVRFFGRLDHAAWRRSLDRLVARHEALRTRFVSHEGVPHIILADPESGFALLEHDLSGESDPLRVLGQLCSDEASASFDLSSGPLIRGRLIRVAPDEHVFLLTQHHIVSDGWSLGVIFNELSALYRAFASGHDDPLPPLPIQYPDFAAWQRHWLSGERLQRQANYWRDQLSSAPVLLELPTDRPKPEQQSFAGAYVPITLDAELSLALKQLSLQHGTTLFMTLLAAWATVLSRLSGQHDIVIGTPTANRNRHELEPLVGFFVNTLALRIDLSGNPSVGELLARVRKTTLGAQDHDDLPFEQVVEIAQPPRSLAHSPICQVMFAWHMFPWQKDEKAALELPGLRVQPMPDASSTVKLDIALDLAESQDRIVGGLRYATALWDAVTIERHRGYLLAVLHAMVADAHQPSSSIELLSSAERTLLVDTWNRTETDYSHDNCVHQLFEQQVDEVPDAIAVVQGDVQLTYAELNAQANQLAHLLIAKGVRPDQRVGICVDRRPHMLVGLLAILKAGGAYVPLDPTYPRERLLEVLGDSLPTVLLTDDVGRRALDDELATPIIAVDQSSDYAHLPATNPDPLQLGLSPSHLAYVIYTSGSTSKPKGVMVEHRGAVNFAHAMIGLFGTTRDSRVLLFASMSFDASVLELLMAIASGAAMHLPTHEQRHDAGALAEYLIKTSSTHALLPPALLQASAGELQRWPFQTLILGGEAPDGALLRSFGDDTAVFNAYGPTEATVCATVWRRPSEFATVCIGRPIANTRIYLLDSYGQPVPLGAVGEIHIGGVGVARGYLNRPELTAERFLRDPFTHEAGARMYRTGDLARYLPDGNLVFLGRSDGQVKLRGFRIEVGEIESRLLQHESVREAVVVARQDESEDKRLVAYVTSRGDEELQVSALREHLARQLPEHMVPSAFVRLERLPLTPNGKLNRKALPAPDAQAVVTRAYEPPQGKIEEKLAGIWSELLGIERIGRNDHFFELGGNSLLVARMVARAQPLRPEHLFETPILRELAATFSACASEGVRDRAIPIRLRSRRAPIFFVPTGRGDYDYTYALARDLDDSLPIYALPWPDVRGAARSIEGMAAHVIEWIRAVQPSGPYHVAGYSLGGVLAYAIAQQLLDTGDDIAFVGLIDVPLDTERQLPDRVQQLFLAWLYQAVPLSARDRVEALARTPLSLQALISEAQTMTSVSDLSSWQQSEEFSNAAYDFQPKPVPGVHVFRASETTYSPLGYRLPKCIIDPTFGWRTVLGSALAMHTIRGDHHSIMEVPCNRRELGHRISRAILERRI